MEKEGKKYLTKTEIQKEQKQKMEENSVSLLHPRPRLPILAEVTLGWPSM
jgi:hypothetical protein